MFLERFEARLELAERFVHLAREGLADVVERLLAGAPTERDALNLAPVAALADEHRVLLRPIGAGRIVREDDVVATAHEERRAGCPRSLGQPLGELLGRVDLERMEEATAVE